MIGFRNIFKKKSNELESMQYIGDQQGIMRRYIREKEKWESHLYQCKKFIIETANTKKKGTVVVLGSGWWLDLPVDELASAFQELILIDIVHPEQMKVKARNYPNLKLIADDITAGLVSKVYEICKDPNALDLLKKMEITPYTIPYDADFIISLNILNQLDILICDYIKSKIHCPEEELLLFRAKIQQAHINSLPHHKTCLISDIVEINTPFDKSRESRSRSLIYVDFPPSRQVRSWLWDFDSSGNYHEKMQTRFEVLALDF